MNATVYYYHDSSEVLTPFRVEAKEPFVVEAFEGLLDPFSSITLLASFKPKVVAQLIIFIKYSVHGSNNQNYIVKFINILWSEI